MSEPHYDLLPESHDPHDVVDDLEFTDVTNHGETYTLYRIVRFTHEVTSHPSGWTHLANVVRVRKRALGTALLRVVNRSIEDSEVTLSPTQT